VRDFRATAKGGLKYPENQEGLDAILAPTIARHSVTALRAANDLYAGRVIGQYETSLADLKILAANAPTDAEFAQYHGQAQALTKDVEALLGPKGAAERRIKTRQEFAAARATREIDLNPSVDVLGKYQGLLTPEAENTLLRRIGVVQQQRLADSDRRERAVKAQLEADTKVKVAELDGKLIDKSLTLHELEVYGPNGLRVVLGDDYRRLRTGLVKPEKDAPSDKDILSRVGLDAESVTPRTTPAEIDRLHEAFRNNRPGLNFADAARIKQQLRTTSESHRNEVKADLLREHGQAEQELRGILGIKPGMIAQAMGDDPITRLYGQGLTELRQNSSAFDGKERPLHYFTTNMRDRYQKAAGQNAQLKLNELRTLTPTRQDLERVFRTGGITRDVYMQELGRFEERERLEPMVTPPVTLPKIGPRLGEPKK